jgi:uncharacterized membrane protein YgdD (TMEM256/DUF423 family)
MWHALALFALVLVGRLEVVTFTGSLSTAYYGSISGVAVAAGWLFAAGIVLFSGSLYVLSLTRRRSSGAVTPVGSVCLVLGWAMLLVAIVVK